MGVRVFLQRGDKHQDVEIEALRVVNDNQLIKFRGVDTMTEAYGLVGFGIYSEKNPTPEPVDEHTVDLIGWTLCDQDGSPLGEIADVLDRILQPLLVIRDQGNHEHLVPLVEEWLLEMDADSKRVHMSLPEGLIGIN